jgi:methylamine utilization protein MauE
MSTANKNKISEIISVLFIFIFVYTGISKLTTIIAFRNTILLTSAKDYASLIAYAIPIAELITACLLFIHKTRNTGFIVSLVLMIVFTSHIGIMLLTAKDLPCTCGGVISKLSWKQHLWFNLFLISMLLWAIANKKNNSTIYYNKQAVSRTPV